MEKGNKIFLDLIIRYLLMVVVAIPNLFIFYFIFTPLTIYPSFAFFKLFFDASLNNNFIILSNGTVFEFVNACIAGSAYYLLFILNFTTPKIKIKKRILLLLVTFSSLLLINLLRIISLGVILDNYGIGVYQLTHDIFWYSLSAIFVGIIWLFWIRMLKIKEIPVYSDFKLLLKEIKNAK